jgi:hypothetical protein
VTLYDLGFLFATWGVVLAPFIIISLVIAACVAAWRHHRD